MTCFRVTATSRWAIAQCSNNNAILLKLINPDHNNIEDRLSQDNNLTELLKQGIYKNNTELLYESTRVTAERNYLFQYMAQVGRPWVPMTSYPLQQWLTCFAINTRDEESKPGVLFATNGIKNDQFARARVFKTNNLRWTWKWMSIEKMNIIQP